eukprot:TRINITY_DN21780_c0_g1_i1.p1 TRINITY_DN21780_c0_g1~~TRINITY_DN21780_c0_g1_i1.p1  ORF type:complete len:627 (-),score=101.05 TRINITY_DN21780_c0_g1_i1:16-1896(-)
MENESLIAPTRTAPRRKVIFAATTVFVVGALLGVAATVGVTGTKKSSSENPAAVVSDPFASYVEPKVVPSAKYQAAPDTLQSEATTTTEQIIANTTKGQVRGFINVNENGIRTRQFRGIPYAKPPVGPLRFAQPQSPDSWAPNVRDALHSSFACPQFPHAPYTDPTAFKFPIYSSEDCLYLDVIAPDDDNKEKPVMVWIHGGQYLWGAGSSPIWNADDWVNTDNFVLVKFNYRLGVFGSLYFGDSDGQNTVRDQRLVLQWVQDNIRNFGGNPQAVTVFGLSAGGYSAAIHQLSPLSKGLFNRVILQSAPYHRLQSPARASDIAARILKNTTCDQYPDHMGCLRVVPVNALLLAEWVATPTLDFVGNGDWNFWDLLELYAPVNGDAVQIPNGGSVFHALLHTKNWNAKQAVIGIVKEEAQGMVPPIAAANPELFQAKNYLGGLVTLFGTIPGIAVYLTYPLPSGATSWAPTLIKLLNDVSYCTAARESVNLGAVSYLYHYNHVNSWIGFDDPADCTGHVCHAADLETLFGTIQRSGRVYQPNELKLVRAMQQSWASFARSGIPETDEFTWPAYNILTRESVELDWPVTVASHLAGHHCHFWDATGYHWITAGTTGQVAAAAFRSSPQ